LGEDAGAVLHIGTLWTHRPPKPFVHGWGRRGRDPLRAARKGGDQDYVCRIYAVRRTADAPEL